MKYLLIVIAFHLYARMIPMGIAQNFRKPVQESRDSEQSFTGHLISLKNFNAKALEIPQVKNMLSQCQREASQQKADSKDSNSGNLTSEQFEMALDECFKNKMSELPPAQAKQIAEQLAPAAPPRDPNAPPGEQKNELFRLKPDQQDNFNFKTRSSYGPLEKFLVDRLEKELYGDSANTKQRKFVDHRIYYQLYKSQLGKDILSYLGEYCMNSNDHFLISINDDERKDTRDRNLKALSKFQQNSEKASNKSGNNLTGNPSNEMNEGFAHFSGCLARITHICGRTKLTHPDGRVEDFSTDSMFKDYSMEDDDKNENKSEQFEKDVEYTRNQACVVSRQLKKVRDKLLQVRDLESKLDTLKADDRRGFSMDLSGKQQIYGNDNPNEKNIDELTSLTSNEFRNTAGAQMRKDATTWTAKCMNQVGPECNKLANSGVDYQNFLNYKDEYNARTQLLKARIKAMSEMEVKEFLQKEGRTQPEIDLILRKSRESQNAQQLRDQIAERYEREREAVIKSLMLKIKGSDLSMSASKPANAANGAMTPPNPQETKALRESIEKRLMGKEEQMLKTIMYNNIVAGYLQVQDQSGKSVQNSQTALRELGDSAFDPKNRMPMRPSSPESKVPVPTIDPKFFMELQTNTKRSLRPAPTGANKSSQTSFEVETLNVHVLGDYQDVDPKSQESLDNIEKQRKANNQNKTKAPSTPPSNNTNNNAPNSFNPMAR